jgi:hypothetical protein
MAYRYKKISVNGRKVDEHRYIMEQHLGRYLNRNEVVRHINGNVRDNRIENLYLINKKLQPFTQIAEGSHYSLSHEDKNISKQSCRTKFGRKVMICDRDGNSLMIVGSVRLAARLIGVSNGNAQRHMKNNSGTIKNYKLKYQP